MKKRSMRSRATMFRVIFVAGISFALVFMGGMGLADEPTGVLEQLGALFFGDEEEAGTLVVDSEPKGALVFVDNVLKGKTPCTLGGIAPRTVTVEVELEGYAPQDKELKIQPGLTQTLKFSLERARAEAATAVALSAEPAGFAMSGGTVTIQAKGSGGTGKYDYRFLKKGPATGEKWVEAQGYSSKSSWTWKTTADDVGWNRIAVGVRSAGSKATEAEASKRMVYEVHAVAPATGVALSADLTSPTVRGSAVTFQAKGSGGTGNYEYRFLKKGPATGGKWVEAQGFSPKSSWTWKTAADDIGSNRIAVAVRSAGSKATDGEVGKRMVYEVAASRIEALLLDLEKKIADADKRKVANPSFLEELKDLVERYKKDIKAQ